MYRMTQSWIVPIEKTPAWTALMEVSADTRERQGLLASRIELRNTMINATWLQSILPDPEHLINGIQSVDLEFIISIRSRNEHFEIVVLIDAGVSLGKCRLNLGLLRGEAEVEKRIIPEERNPGVEPSGPAGDDVYEPAGLGSGQPGRLIQPPVDYERTGSPIAGVVGWLWRSGEQCNSLATLLQARKGYTQSHAPLSILVVPHFSSSGLAHSRAADLFDLRQIT